MFLQTQIDIVGGGLLAIAVTFVLAWLFYAFTLHLAATYFIGDVPSQLAAKASLVPVCVSFLVQQYGIAETALISPRIDLLIAVGATLVADGLAISYSYRLPTRPTMIVTFLHFAFAVVLAFALNNIFGFV